MAAGEWPHTVGFEKLVTALRKKKQPAPTALRLPPGLPADMRPVVQAQCAAVLADLPKLLDAAVPLRNLPAPHGGLSRAVLSAGRPLGRGG